MSARRTVLYSVYGLLRSLGYFGLRDRIVPYATVLTFHRVNDKEDKDGLSVHPRLFEELLDVLAREYRIVPLARVLEMMTTKSKPIPARTMSITFDDGYLDNFAVAAPILRQRNIPATFFVSSGYVGTMRKFPWDVSKSVSHPLMTWDQVRQLAAEGFEIGAHSVNHLNLGVCSPDVAEKEIIGSKRHIEDQLGAAISGFAYPFGWKQSMNEVASLIVREAGFAYCCSNYGGKVTNQSDRFNIQRTGVYPTTTEMLMEIDNFMTHYDGLMRMHVFGVTVPVGSSGSHLEGRA
ncbi:MAG: polysaccharide deacetylase family protein [Nitrospira sp.]|nr:polysaccharide deacetylase family protein [Nitrospira sp.]